MHLCYKLSNSQKVRHRPKRLALIIHIESGKYHPFSIIGQCIADSDNVVVKKLSFINSDYIAIS